VTWSKKIAFAFYSLFGLISAFLFSWIVLAQVDFGYSGLYEVMDIKAHVKKFGPQNRFRRHFHLTTKDEHERLFSAINDAIHNDGKGLDKLAYHTPKGQKLNTLLRVPEVVHLKDVANLVNVFFWIGGLAFLLWLAATAYFFIKRIELPSVKIQSISILALCAVATVVTLIIGPVTVFYAFHEWLFPENHQWFFYYQESLMTILMKAPFLFGYIAILLVVLALIVFVGVNWMLARVERRLIENNSKGEVANA